MKVERLLAIVMLLMNKDKITASELAEYFEVSVRTIVRDMEAINMAGIPIVAHQGKNGGFSILKNYKVDKNFLTPDEIAAILRALSGVNKALSDKSVNNIMEKVQGLIPKDKIEDINKRSQKLIIDMTPWERYNPQEKKVALIKEALEERRVISFKYISPNGLNSERLVEPISLVLKLYSWYIYGYCRARNDYRLFKVSRMKDLNMLEDTFEEKEGKVEEFPWQKSFISGFPQHIVMKFNPTVRNRVEEYFDESSITYDEAGNLIVSVNYPEDEWVYSMILSYGGEVEVVKPKHIRDIIRERALKISNIYNK